MLSSSAVDSRMDAAGCLEVGTVVYRSIPEPRGVPVHRDDRYPELRNGDRGIVKHFDGSKFYVEWERHTIPKRK